MRKKKWKKILIWTLSVIVVLGIGGLFAANYAINRLISTLSADLESNLITDDGTSLDIATDNLNNDNSQVGNKTPIDHALESTSQPDGTVTGVEPAEKEPDKINQESSNTENGDSIESKEQQKPNVGYSAEISADKARDVQEKITVSEKAQVSSVLLEELSISDIKQIQALASGGLSLEEKKKARSIILEKLSAEQYDELIQVAKKYGMSQGKSYEEVIEEE